MSTVQSFENTAPPPRFDGEPWTVVHVEALISEVWTEEFFDDIPIDATPETPNTVDVSFPSALEKGWFRFRFRDANDFYSPYSVQVYSPSDGVPIIPTDGPTWIPTLEDVSAIMRARTKDSGMKEIGTFTQETRVTGNQAALIIYNETMFVRGIVGSDPTPNISGIAKGLAKLRSAMFIESSYYPEQIERGNSPFKSWQDQYKIDLKLLMDILGSDTQVPGESEDGTGMPSFAYPENKGGLVGWGTKF